MSVIEFRALGAVDLRRRDGPELLSVLSQPKRSALLAYLLLARPRGFQRRDRLVALFWPEADDEHGRNSLRQSIHFLRRSLGEDVLESRNDDEIRIAGGRVWCDAQAFEESLERGDAEEALKLYGGELLPGFFVEGAPEFERWLEAERARLRTRALKAASEAARARERAGDGAGAVELGRRALELAPDDASPVRAQMELLQRLGDAPAAIACYESHARRLLLDYELEPTPELRTLADELRARHNLAAAGAATSSPTPTPTAMAAAPAPATVQATTASSGPATSPAPATSAAAPVSPAPAASPGPATSPAPAWRMRAPGSLRIAASVAVLAALGGFWAARARTPRVDPRRVVVVPFENATGDSTLAALGPMIADVVTQAVATSGFAEAVPPPPPPDPHAPAAPALPAQEFARAARAGIVVAGRYYLVGDTVVVESHAVTLESGGREIGVRVVRGPRQRPDSVAEAARDRVLGVLAVQLDRPEGDRTPAAMGVRPPTYEAYRAYVAGIAMADDGRNVESAAYLRRALQLDSTFYTAAVVLSWVLWNSGQQVPAESVMHAVAAHRDELDPESRIDLEMALANAEGDWARTYRIVRDLPGRTWFSNHDLAIAAMALRRPREALRLLETGPPPQYVAGTERWSGFHTLKCNALHLLGDYEGELRAARRGRELFPDMPNMVMREGRALAALGRAAEAGVRIEALLRRRPAYALEIVDVLALRDAAAARAYYARALAALERAPDTSSVAATLRARTLLALGRTAQARALADSLHARQPRRPDALLYLGVAAARAGDRATVAAVERALAALPGTRVAGARNTMRRAMIASALGERGRAVQLIADAYAGGYPYEPPLLYAPELAPLHGYAPFDELIRPLDR